MRNLGKYREVKNNNQQISYQRINYNIDKKMNNFRNNINSIISKEIMLTMIQMMNRHKDIFIRNILSVLRIRLKDH